MKNPLLINLNDDQFYELLLDKAICQYHPPINNQVILLLDISHNTRSIYKTLVLTQQANIYKTSKEIQQVFLELQHYHGLSYNNCSEWVQIHSHMKKKIPYIINGCLYFQVKNLATDHTHWIAYHHQIDSLSKDKTDQPIIHFNEVDVLLPITCKTYQQNMKEYDHLIHKSRQFYCNLREYIDRSDCESKEPIYFSPSEDYSLSNFFEIGVKLTIHRLFKLLPPD